MNLLYTSGTKEGPFKAKLPFDYTVEGAAFIVQGLPGLSYTLFPRAQSP